ncbi:MAG: hypothetical protein Q8R13_04155 [bacterium]|nr:hypothetical protein [bacterium]
MTAHETIVSLLRGKALGIPAERLDWTGYTSVYKLFKEASPDHRERIIDAMIQIIEQARGSQDEELWQLAADTIHLGYSLRIGRLQGIVEGIDPGKVPEPVRDSVTYACETYLKNL